MINKNIWEKIEHDFLLHPEDFGGRVAESKIKNAEEQLNIQFSKPYNRFICEYGSGVFPGHIVYGLVPLDGMGTFIKNVIEKTRFYKNEQKWPGIEDWYIISDDGSGNPIGIDSEGRVWLSDHDSGFEKIKLAEDFEEFLSKLYTDTLWD